ncbi:MAG: hypothetical protein R2728_03430 [Chitinophagales bacterium]
MTNVNIHSDWDEVESVIEKINNSVEKANSDALVFDCYAAICKASNTFFDAERSLNYAIKLVSNISSENDATKKIRAYLLLGKALELNGNKKDAFENYLKVQELITQLGKEEKETYSYELNAQLFDFYLKINQFDKAVDHKMQQIEYLSHSSIVDTPKLMWLKLDLCRLHLAEDKGSNIIPQLEEVIKYSEDNEQLDMFINALSTYRSVLLNNEDIEGFHELFVERYPKNLLDFKKDAISTYYVIVAFIKEYEGEIDSASYYFMLAEDEVKKEDNDVFSANFYKRYGEFYLRIGQTDKALDKFKVSYEKAKKSDYLDFMIESSEYIESLSLVLENYKNAYVYGKINNELDIRKNQALHEDDMLKMELKSQARKMEILAEKKAEEKRRKFNLQYAIIIVAIMTLFLLLILASSLTVPEWLIEMLGFFSILFLFEFLILLLDHEIHHITHGAPLKIFLIKITILTIIFPLHHIIESNITNYMKKNKMIGKITKQSIKKTLGKLYPWMRDRNQPNAEH